jgi:hypothetical protein
MHQDLGGVRQTGPAEHRQEAADVVVYGAVLACGEQPVVLLQKRLEALEEGRCGDGVAFAVEGDKRVDGGGGRGGPKVIWGPRGR